jgi:hypothetical protein
MLSATADARKCKLSISEGMLHVNNIGCATQADSIHLDQHITWPDTGTINQPIWLDSVKTKPNVVHQRDFGT